MRMDDKIKQAIEKELMPEHLEIINESGEHAGHAGDDGSGETHYKLIVVSSRFKDHNRVQRQRLMNAAVSKLFEEGLHALTMKLLTPQEDNL